MPLAIELMQDLENRSLMKICYNDLIDLSFTQTQKITSFKNDPQKRIDLENRLAETCGCNKDEIMTGLRIIETTPGKQEKTPILIKYEKYKGIPNYVVDIDEVSPIKFEDPIETFYTVCPKSYEDKIASLTIDDIIGLID
jgi:hypothetical protein